VSGLREYLARRAEKRARQAATEPFTERTFVLRDRATGETRGKLVIEYGEPDHRPAQAKDKP
jgi:hypothetical protein